MTSRKVMQRGFSMLEVVVVMVIISVMVMIAVPLIEKKRGEPARLFAQQQMLNISGEFQKIYQVKKVLSQADINRVLANNPVPLYAVTVNKPSDVRTSGGWGGSGFGRGGSFWGGQLWVVVAVPTSQGPLSEGAFCVNDAGATASQKGNSNKNWWSGCPLLGNIGYYMGNEEFLSLKPWN